MSLILAGAGFSGRYPTLNFSMIKVENGLDERETEFCYQIYRPSVSGHRSEWFNASCLPTTSGGPG